MKLLLSWNKLGKWMEEYNVNINIKQTAAAFVRICDNTKKYN